MSWITIKPLPSTYRVHFNGVGYYYTDESGQQLSRVYKTVDALHRYGTVLIWD